MKRDYRAEIEQRLNRNRPGMPGTKKNGETRETNDKYYRGERSKGELGHPIRCVTRNVISAKSATSERTNDTVDNSIISQALRSDVLRLWSRLICTRRSLNARERKKAEREEEVTRLPGRPTINLLANGYALRIIIQSPSFCSRRVQPLKGLNDSSKIPR